MNLDTLLKQISLPPPPPPTTQPEEVYQSILFPKESLIPYLSYRVAKTTP